MKNKGDISLILGQRLRYLRKEKLLTQEELAEKAGLNAKYYSQVERGQRNVSVGSLQRIAEGLEVSVESLFRFPSNSSLTDDDEEIIAMVTLLITQRSKKPKRLARAMLKEILK